MISGNDIDYKDKHFFVVDENCDGGGTFIQLAKVFFAHRHGTGIEKSLNLFVTHGIFSKGLNPLKDAGFNCIGSTDSFINYQNSIDSRLIITVLK